MNVMKIKILTTTLLALITLLFGCQKDDIMLFDTNDSGVVFPGLGDSRIYTGYNSGDNIYYISESFLSIPMTEKRLIVDFPVRISGDSVNYNRVVGYEIIPDKTTATGDQYSIVEALIPAGESYGRIRFELERKEVLDSTTIKVGIRLKDSEDLKVGSNEYMTGVLSWSNMLPMFTNTANYIRTYNCIVLTPLAKTSAVNTYYSPNAHKAILDALGWPINYWPTYTNQIIDPGTGTITMLGVYYTDFYAQKLKAYLDAYADANGGVRLKHNAGLAEGVEIQARVANAVYKP